MDNHQILGAISAGIQLYCFIPYIFGILKGRIKPHIFTWLLWSLVGGIICAAQLSEGAGSGAWLTAVNTSMSFLIACLAVWKGEKNITRIDVILLVLSLTAIPLWLACKTPLWSVIMLCMINACAFFPTVRKSWHQPWYESLQVFLLGGISSTLAVFALQHVNAATLIYPLWTALSNYLFVTMLYLRRRTVKRD